MVEGFTEFGLVAPDRVKGVCPDVSELLGHHVDGSFYVLLPSHHPGAQVLEAHGQGVRSVLGDGLVQPHAVHKVLVWSETHAPR